MEHLNGTKKNKFFGEDCKHLTATWIPEDFDRIKPVLVFCNHPKNKVNLANNCSKENCPLFK